MEHLTVIESRTFVLAVHPDHFMPPCAGAVYLAPGSSNRAELHGCRLSSNRAGLAGGAVYAGSGSLLSLSSSDLRDNACNGAGGAVACSGCSIVAVAGCSMQGNRAGGGGAVAVDGADLPTSSQPSGIPVRAPPGLGSKWLVQRGPGLAGVAPIALSLHVLVSKPRTPPCVCRPRCAAAFAARGVRLRP